jgi:hypothetical protein
MMKKFVFFLCCFAHLSFALEPLYISLGRSCEPAFRLRESNRRFASYPFDWLMSPYESLYHALQDDFFRFFTELSLIHDKTAVVDHYGLIFRNGWLHEGLHYNKALDQIDWEGQIPSMTDKYVRKIDRFREACESGRKVVFIRWEDIDRGKAIRLRDLIRSKYPNLQFTLMVVKNSEEFRSPWGLENIRNLSIETSDLKAWEKAFEEECQ